MHAVEHGISDELLVRKFPIEQLLIDARDRLELARPKQQSSFYAERIRSHLSGDKPSKRLARIFGRWRNFPFTLAVDGNPCEAGVTALALYVRQLFDAVDEDEEERSLATTSPSCPTEAEPSPMKCTREGWLTIRQVSEILDCSYGQARERMLDGRIKTYKDGKHIRSKREWVDEHIQGRLTDDRDRSADVSLGRRRRAKPTKVKPQGIGLRFLQKRGG